jgi:hypothetical protein
MPILVVEHLFDPPLTEASLKAAFDVLGPCLETHGATWLRSYVSSDGRRMICEFEAPDAEAVRASMRSSGTPFERVWPAQVLKA